MPLLRPLCEKYTFDLILLDGGEFLGSVHNFWVYQSRIATLTWSGRRPEFAEVMEHCKDFRYIALHDVNTYKNMENMVSAELSLVLPTAHSMLRFV